VLRWTETGSRIKSEPSPNGFGTKVIEAVERGMRGRIERSWPDSGLAFVFRFPVIDPE
jgi:two-component sensor histidine kinase